jgi:hypothetical protein
MIHIYKFNELNEQVAKHKEYKPEKHPYCVDMENKGYRIGYLKKGDLERFAFDKNFDLDDDAYWLGDNNTEYEFGKKYVADQFMVDNKNKLPFYNLYCKCDNSPNEAQQEMLKKRNKDIAKKQENMQKTMLGKVKNKTVKK